MQLGELPGRWSPLRAFRLLGVALLAVTLLSAGHSFLTYDAHTDEAATAGSDPSTDAEPVVVVTVDGVGPGQIVAYDADGNVVYRNESLGLYHDVDPSPAGEHTVTYVASDSAPSGDCPGGECLRNVIERVNLTTGEVTRLHSWTDTRSGSTQTHDVDRVNGSVFLVADITFPDRVYMVNTTTGEVVWEWRVSDAYEPGSGGDYPSDWTHVNDVEYLPDGRVMVNLRNQDQVVFLDPGNGIQRDWTLGAADDHGVLFEAHNPDYVPAARGGPAVVVADSENNRLVEYQRENGSWVRSWTWQDATMQWPRDADRLPSGRTLVADSHGQRVLSVAKDGTVAWSRSVPTGSYDVELLGTGDESAGGRSAGELRLDSRHPADPVRDGETSMSDSTVGPGVAGTPPERTAPASDETSGAGLVRGGVDARVSVLVYWVTSLVPPLVLHGLLFALPAWATPVDVVLGMATVAVCGGWAVVTVGVRLARWVRADGET